MDKHGRSRFLKNAGRFHLRRINYCEKFGERKELWEKGDQK